MKETTEPHHPTPNVQARHAFLEYQIPMSAPRFKRTRTSGMTCTHQALQSTSVRTARAAESLRRDNHFCVSQGKADGNTSFPVSPPRNSTSCLTTTSSSTLAASASFLAALQPRATRLPCSRSRTPYKSLDQAPKPLRCSPAFVASSCGTGGAEVASASLA